MSPVLAPPRAIYDGCPRTVHARLAPTPTQGVLQGDGQQVGIPCLRNAPNPVQAQVPGLASASLQRQPSILLPALSPSVVDASVLKLDGCGGHRQPWDQHLSALRTQDLEQMLKGYSTGAVIMSYNQANGAAGVYTSAADMADYIGWLLQCLRNCTDFAIEFQKEFKSGSDTDVEIACVVWKCAGSGFHRATETLVFDSTGRISAQHNFLDFSGPSCPRPSEVSARMAPSSGPAYNAWANYVTAFRSRDVQRVLEGYSDASEVAVYNAADGTLQELRGIHEAATYFGHLFRTISDCADFELPLVHVEENPFGRPRAAFLVWSAAASGIDIATTTVIFDTRSKILRQSIVVKFVEPSIVTPCTNAHIAVQGIAGQVLIEFDRRMSGTELKAEIKKAGILPGRRLRLLAAMREIHNEEPVPSNAEESAYITLLALAPLYSVVSWGDQLCGGDCSSVCQDLSEGVTNVVGNGRGFAALSGGKRLVTWGKAAYGGDARSSAERLQGDILDMAGTARSFAALEDRGAVLTWGDPASGGDPGDVAEEISHDIACMAGSASTFAAVTREGAVITWGAASGSPDSAVAEQLRSGVVSLAATRHAFAALTQGGAVLAWGPASYGGDASSVAELLREDVASIVGSASAFAAVTREGRVVTWGNGAAGGDSSSVADRLAGGVVSVVGSGEAFAAVKESGEVVTWGASSAGGDSKAVADRLSAGVVSVAGTARAFAAVTSKGEVVAWGDAGHGGEIPKTIGEQLKSGAAKVVGSIFGGAFVALKPLV